MGTCLTCNKELFSVGETIFPCPTCDFKNDGQIRLVHGKDGSNVACVGNKWQFVDCFIKTRDGQTYPLRSFGKVQF